MPEDRDNVHYFIIFALPSPFSFLHFPPMTYIIYYTYRHEHIVAFSRHYAFLHTYHYHFRSPFGLEFPPLRRRQHILIPVRHYVTILFRRPFIFRLVFFILFICLLTFMLSPSSFEPDGWLRHIYSITYRYSSFFRRLTV